MESELSIFRYSFAIVGINLTHMAYKLLQVRQIVIMITITFILILHIIIWSPSTQHLQNDDNVPGLGSEVPSLQCDGGQAQS